MAEDEFDNQPLWSPDKSRCLVADVRLDNRPDLVRELSLYHPESLSDSEILMAAWQRWGASCLARLLGAFAFAVWTPATRELFLARDHTGERPLFYCQLDDVFAAASMPRGLLTLPGVSREFDEGYASIWLGGLRPDEYTTFFRGIQRLPAGHSLRVTPRSVERKRYWHPAEAAPTRYKRDEEYGEALVDLLDRAVSARLRSSQPIGAFLSSGLDSSSVVASAALSLGRENRGLTAFTSVPRPDFDGTCFPGYVPHEARGAAEVASMYPNVEHTVVDSRGYDLVPTMKKWIDVLDEPLANVTNLLWFNAIVDQARQRNITVMLEGAEGNGTLSWYSWSILGHFFTRGRWLKLGSTARALRGRGALSYKTATRYALRPIIPKWLTHRLIRKENLVGLYDRLLHPDRMQRYGIAKQIFDALYHRPLNVVEEQSRLFNMYDRGPFRAATQALTGIELRDPTADKRIYEFCLSIPPEQYVVEGHSRSLARRAMKGRIPDSIRLRYTRGLQSADWQIPMVEALPDIQEELQLEEQSAAVHEALDMPEINRLLEQWPTGGFHKPEVFRRWNFALLPALSLGYFLRSHESATNALTSLPTSPCNNIACVATPANLNPPRYSYFYGPFRLESEVEIPELRDSAGPGDRLVRVLSGSVPEHLVDAVSVGRAAEVTATEFLLKIDGVARYRVANGDEVRVEAVAGVRAADVSAYLLGSCFGALCHQNGLLPLHASAIAAGDTVTAFLGDSGAGKSTLAACLHRRGHAIVSDDICLLDPSDPANPRVIPVAGWLKLWNQSLEHLGHTPEEEHRVYSTDDKYRVFLRGPGDAPRRLTRVVFLDKAESAEAPPSLARLSVPEAVAALMDLTYAVYIPVLTGQQPRLFRDCAGIFRHAEAYRLKRPWSLERTDEVLDFLERELLDSAPQAAES